MSGRRRPGPFRDRSPGGEDPRAGRALPACVHAHDRAAEHGAKPRRGVGHRVAVPADARDPPQIGREHRGGLADLLPCLDQLGRAVVEALLAQQQLDDGARHEAHEHQRDDELDEREAGPADRGWVRAQHGRKLRNVSVRWRWLLRKVTFTVTSSARARRLSVHASEMPRLTADPPARLTHGVARTRSKRDSATLAAMVRDWVLVSVDMITDAVPAMASRPTLKIMTATRSSTMV